MGVEASNLTTLEYVNKKIRQYSLTCKAVGGQLIFYEDHVPIIVLYVTKTQNLFNVRQINQKAASQKRYCPDLRVGIIFLGTSKLPQGFFREGRNVDFFSPISEKDPKDIQKRIVKIIIEELFS